MNQQTSSTSVSGSSKDYKALIMALTNEQRTVFDQICKEEPMPSLSISYDLEQMGLVSWYQLDLMSGFYEVASPEIYCAWQELNAIASQEKQPSATPH